MAEKLQFGEYPLHVSLADDVYSVAAQDVASAEACGINESFEASRLEIMKARGLAHGYVLIEEEKESESHG